MVLSEEISREVGRVEIWKWHIIMAWVMIRKQLACVMGRTDSRGGHILPGMREP